MGYDHMTLTFGDVADARSGRSPPHAMMRLSASCEMRCTVFTTNTAFSAAFTKSSTDLVECDRQTCGAEDILIDLAFEFI